MTLQVFTSFTLLTSVEEKEVDSENAPKKKRTMKETAKDFLIQSWRIQVLNTRILTHNRHDVARCFKYCWRPSVSSRRLS